MKIPVLYYNPFQWQFSQVMHNISIYGEQFKSPSNWDEVTSRDLLNIAIYTSSGKYAQMTAFYLVVALFKIPIHVFLKLKQSEKVLLTPLIDWVYSKNSASKWLIRWVKAGNYTLYGPKDKLSDLTAEEFMYTEAAYERWLSSENPEFLDNLFGVLYRKKHFYLDKRVSFSVDKMPFYEQKAKNVKLYVKKAVAINYAGCRNLIIERHPNIWVTPAEGTKAQQKKSSNTAWADFFMAVSENMVFGPWESTIKTNLWLVLRHLDKKAKDVKELEAPK